MRIAVVHNAVSNASTPDEQDVLVQAAAVSESLRLIGHEVTTLPCTLDLAFIKRRLESLNPDLVFNLVESLGGHGRLIHVFPALLDAMGLRYTGASAEALFLTSHKVMAKKTMLACGIPTPAWLGPYPEDSTSTPCPSSLSAGGSAGKWIIKSLWEHASVGLESESVIEGTSEIDIFEKLPGYTPQLGGACFAEQYVHGREFNLSLLAGPESPLVLPPAEIVFDGYDPSRPLVVGYRAKWEANSYEYRHTSRRFRFDSQDESLLALLENLALQCWLAFRLSGYARIDFRVDALQQPWILEINANPCLSPDAGFAAAVIAAGLDFTQAVGRIIQDGIPSLPDLAAGVADVSPHPARGF